MQIFFLKFVLLCFCWVVCLFVCLFLFLFLFLFCFDLFCFVFKLSGLFESEKIERFEVKRLAIHAHTVQDDYGECVITA